MEGGIFDWKLNFLVHCTCCQAPDKDPELDLRRCNWCHKVAYYQNGACLNVNCWGYKGKCTQDNVCKFSGQKARWNHQKRGSKGKKRREWWKKFKAGGPAPVDMHKPLPGDKKDPEGGGSSGDGFAQAEPIVVG